ncbi:hypothetical protein K457DRAFT_129864 [Linnemannia elongata AG-77]|uniref:Uncharacterized protein n=1 Tax=Linnemannia elongata AG-77 TaxID=1314771 RepID=A0A197JIK0_9FUNG|nr:hypothetical protein K457DRAFT_129864 [Linnemannia elongata AG-77]
MAKHDFLCGGSSQGDKRVGGSEKGIGETSVPFGLTVSVPLRPAALISLEAAIALTGTLVCVGGTVTFPFLVKTIALKHYHLVLNLVLVHALVLVPDLYPDLGSVTLVLVLVLDLFHLIVKAIMAALDNFRDLLKSATDLVRSLEIIPDLSQTSEALLTGNEVTRIRPIRPFFHDLAPLGYNGKGNECTLQVPLTTLIMLRSTPA